MMTNQIIHTLLEPTRIAPWNNAYELTFYHCNVLPPHVEPHLINCAFILAFDKHHNLLLGKHALRGFDLPGGKCEEGETPEETACRECAEEVGLRLTPEDLTLLGYESVHDPGKQPHNPKYPFPTAYFVFYVAGNVDSNKLYVPRSSTGDHEMMTETKWFTDPEIRGHKWFVERPKVLDVALKLLHKE
jgi:8-oxo-dGTP pyrophosphatase MutT (NUDIX family)